MKQLVQMIQVVQEVQLLGREIVPFLMLCDEHVQWMTMSENYPYVSDFRKEQEEEDIDDSFHSILWV